jgi:hypothetical protein
MRSGSVEKASDQGGGGGGPAGARVGSSLSGASSAAREAEAGRLAIQPVAMAAPALWRSASLEKNQV